MRLTMLACCACSRAIIAIPAAPRAPTPARSAAASSRRPAARCNRSGRRRRETTIDVVATWTWRPTTSRSSCSTRREPEGSRRHPTSPEEVSTRAPASRPASGTRRSAPSRAAWSRSRTSTRARSRRARARRRRTRRARARRPGGTPTPTVRHRQARLQPRDRGRPAAHRGRAAELPRRRRATLLGVRPVGDRPRRSPSSTARPTTGSSSTSTARSACGPTRRPGGGDTDIAVDDQGNHYFVDLEALVNLGTSVSNDNGNTWRKNPRRGAERGRRPAVVRRRQRADRGAPRTTRSSSRSTRRAVGTFIYSSPGSTGPTDPVGGLVWQNSSANAPQAAGGRRDLRRRSASTR